jgi:hypothetical protein
VAPTHSLHRLTSRRSWHTLQFHRRRTAEIRTAPCGTPLPSVFSTPTLGLGLYFLPSLPSPSFPPHPFPCRTLPLRHPRSPDSPGYTVPLSCGTRRAQRSRRGSPWTPRSPAAPQICVAPAYFDWTAGCLTRPAPACRGCHPPNGPHASPEVCAAPQGPVPSPVSMATTCSRRPRPNGTSSSRRW